MKRADVKIGDCYRYVGEDAVRNPRPNGGFVLCGFDLPADLPQNWRGGVTTLGEHSGANCKVELIEHYSTHPVPTPKKQPIDVTQHSYDTIFTNCKPSKKTPCTIVEDFKLFEAAMHDGLGHWTKDAYGRKVILGLTFERTEACRIEWSRQLREKVEASIKEVTHRELIVDWDPYGD